MEGVLTTLNTRLETVQASIDLLNQKFESRMIDSKALE